MTTTAPKTLDELFALMKNEDDDAWRAAGLIFDGEDRDWTCLPTFGGGEARYDTICVWSWDATRQIEGTCSADIKIVERVGPESLPEC